MEKQWEEATKALNEHTLHAQLQDAMAKLTASNDEVIRLKKENQIIRLENNLVNPADAAAQKDSDLARESYRRELDELTAKLKRVERERAEEIEALKVKNVTLTNEVATLKVKNLTLTNETKLL